MKTKALILKLAAQKPYLRSSDVLKRKKVSRQTLAQHFRELIAAGKLIKVGATKGAKYFLASKRKRAGGAIPSFEGSFHTHRLEEDRVFQQVDLRLRLKKHLSKKGLNIIRFAFTEMVNNAIEHSRAPRVQIQFLCDGLTAFFRVADKGVGVFENVRKKFGLKDHFEACEHLLKGKQTTDPKHHSGQGIFFTSKIADQFILESDRLRLTVDNRLPDIFLEEIKRIKGTRVSFRIKQKTAKDLKKLFDEYSDNNYEFDKTYVTLRLMKKEGPFVSRSEAKRLLFGLEMFKRIVLDFKNVGGVGQGFADEIFRVFQSRHPHIKLQPIHMNDPVRFLVERARRETLQ